MKHGLYYAFISAALICLAGGIAIGKFLVRDEIAIAQAAVRSANASVNSAFEAARLRCSIRWHDEALGQHFLRDE